MTPEIFPGYFALAASFARVHEMRRRMAAESPEDDEPSRDEINAEMLSIFDANEARAINGGRVF